MPRYTTDYPLQAAVLRWAVHADTPTTRTIFEDNVPPSSTILYTEPRLQSRPEQPHDSEFLMPEKVAFSLDKHTWHPSPLVGQIVLVTTCNADGTSNIAPKSWISLMAFEPPLLAIGCNQQHWTAQNILHRHAFVVNVPGDDLAQAIWDMPQRPHPRPVEAVGLTALPALKVAPPRVAECKAHLECILVQHLAYGDELVFLGQIVAFSLDQEALAATDPYTYFRLVVFLEQGTYGVIEQAQRIAKTEP